MAIPLNPCTTRKVHWLSAAAFGGGLIFLRHLDLYRRLPPSFRSTCKNVNGARQKRIVEGRKEGRKKVLPEKGRKPGRGGPAIKIAPFREQTAAATRLTKEAKKLRKPRTQLAPNGIHKIRRLPAGKKENQPD